MKYLLNFDYLQGILRIDLEGDVEPDSWRILARRDPLEPIEFKTGNLYFNPFGVKQQLYTCLEVGALSSVYNGHSPPKSHFRNPELLRSWFEIPPMRLGLTDIPVTILQMIRKVPKLHGPIAQLIMREIGVRVPAKLVCTNQEEWTAWLLTQTLPLIPIVRAAFQSGDLHINDDISISLRSGSDLIITKQVKLRYYVYKEVLKLSREIYESQDHYCKVPIEIINKGYLEILEYVKKEKEKEAVNWKQTFDFPAAVELTVDVPSSQAPVEGARLWVEEANGKLTPLIGPVAGPAQPLTIQDIIDKALNHI